MMGIGSDPYALNPGGRRAELEMMKAMLRQMQSSSSPFYESDILLPEFHEW
jgi:hypothetical protein